MYEEIIVNGQQESLDWTTGNMSGYCFESWLGGIFAGKEIDTIKADLGDMENAMDAINSRMAKALYQGKDKSKSSRTDHER